MATLPINWLAIAATVVGLVLYTWDFQRNELGLRSIAGTALLIYGGFAITNAAPQFGPSWWAVLLTVAGLALFYLGDADGSLVALGKATEIAPDYVHAWLSTG